MKYLDVRFSAAEPTYSWWIIPPCIEDPLVIKKILEHLDAKSMALTSANQLPEPRAPPQAELFD